MKHSFSAALVTALAAGIIAGCGQKVELGGSKKGPRFRFAPITRADIVRTVEATGMVTPRNSPNGIPVGAQVNGKIIKLFVDYNSVVTNGQVVALIDPQVYEANYKSAVAQLHANEANVEVRIAALKSCEAELKLAEKTFGRKKALVEKNSLESLRADYKESEQRCQKLSGELKAALARVSDLTREAARLKEALKGIGDEEASQAKADVSDAKAVLEDDRESVRPDETLDILDAKALLDANEDENSSPVIKQAADAKAKRDAAAEAAKNRPKTPEEILREKRPSHYVVQEGDTLYKIAMRFYGRSSVWSRIRDANKAVISTDGRGRAGQKLVLPND